LLDPAANCVSDCDCGCDEAGVEVFVELPDSELESRDDDAVEVASVAVVVAVIGVLP